MNDSTDSTDSTDRTPGAGDEPGAHLRTVEIEVEADPDAVWAAIATAQGNAGWLFPAEIEGRVGGEARFHRQPYGGTALAEVLAWEPPHRFAYGEPRSTIPGGDVEGEPWVTEMLVEARSGGTCVVRVVTGFRRHGDGWEAMVDGAAEGWRGALAILKAYLAHFAGQPAATLDASIEVPVPPGEAAAVAERLLASLGVSGLAAGDPFATAAGTPPLSGTVEGIEVGGGLLVAEEPAPALVEVSGFFMGGDGVQATVALRYYGDDAAAQVDAHRAEWTAWIEAQAEALQATVG